MENRDTVLDVLLEAKSEIEKAQGALTVSQEGGNLLLSSVSE